MLLAQSAAHTRRLRQQQVLLDGLCGAERRA